MGLSAAQVKDMSVWEFNAQMIGWSKQFEQDDPGMSEADKDAVWEWLQSKDDVPLSHNKRRSLQ